MKPRLRPVARIIAVIATMCAMLSAVPATADAAPADDSYNALTPARILDTRSGVGAKGPIGRHGEISLDVTGKGGVPATGVGAVALNVTVTDPTAASYVTVWPDGSPRPLASNLNMITGQTIPNLVITKVGTDGRIRFYNNSGNTHLVADVVGWFPTQSDYRSINPSRALDTRDQSNPVGSRSEISLDVASHLGVAPGTIGAVALNVTVTDPTAASYVTVWPDESPRPLASNLNMVAGQTIPNLVITKVGTDGRIRFYNNSGNTHLVADVVGWFPTQSDYRSTNPARVLDTRIGNGAAVGKVPPRGVIEVQVTGRGGIPAAGVGSVVLNVTVTEPTAGSFVTEWPAGDYRPLASTLNMVAGETLPNLVVAKVGEGGKIALYNNAGHAHLVADVAGWFPGTTPPPLGDLARLKLKATPVASASQPVAMATRKGSNSLFVAEQSGNVVEVRPGQPNRTILDLPSGLISTGGERGLLGLAFNPIGNKLYINHTDGAGDTAIAEYTMASDGTANPASRRAILGIDQPASNHNGGDIAFGPDGYLYIATGDGGGGGDPFNNGQNANTLLGGVLRIDPSSPSGGRQYGIPASNPYVNKPGADELWTIGARNPWRISFDADRGDLWVADVGQGDVEEIDLLRADLGRGRGANLGWPIFEGSRPFRGGATPPGYVPPIHEYSHARGRSITGGYVYRGSAIPDLVGTYVYGDFFTSRLWGFRGGSTFETVDFGTAVPGGTLASFGQGPDGELYTLSLSGTIARIEAA